MDRRELLRKIFGISVTCSLFYLGYQFYIMLSTLDPQTRAAIIAALCAVLLAIFTTIKQKEKDLELKMREQKLPAYERILEMYRSTFLSTKKGIELDTDEMVKKHYEINHALLLAGSSKVLSEWNSFYQWLVGQADQDQTEEQIIARIVIMRALLSRVIRSIRHDLGHKDKEISDEEVADLMLPLQNDLKQSIKEYSLKNKIANAIPGK